MGVRFPSPVRTGPGAHPASHTMGTASFPGVKRPGRDVDHPPHLASRLKEEYSYASTPPLGLRGVFYGERYLYKDLIEDQRPRFYRRPGHVVLALNKKAWHRVSSYHFGPPPPFRSVAFHQCSIFLFVCHRTHSVYVLRTSLNKPKVADQTFEGRPSQVTFMISDYITSMQQVSV